MAKKSAKKTSGKAPRKAPRSKTKRTAAKRRPERPKVGKPAKTARPARAVRPVRSKVLKPAKPPKPVPKAQKTPPVALAGAETEKPRTHLSPKDLEHFKQKLLALRDRELEHISFLAGDNLNQSQKEASGDLSSYGFHMADQGTDNFDREFSLALASNGQDILYEINEALQRIENGTYGICELTGRPIERARLEAIPYTRYCREAQEQLEKRQKRFRSFASAPIPTDIAPFGTAED